MFIVISIVHVLYITNDFTVKRQIAFRCCQVVVLVYQCCISSSGILLGGGLIDIWVYCDPPRPTPRAVPAL